MTLRAQIDAALQGRLVLGLTPDRGSSGLRIRMEDADRQKFEVADPKAEGLIPATAFGVSVGIKDKVNSP